MSRKKKRKTQLPRFMRKPSLSHGPMSLSEAALNKANLASFMADDFGCGGCSECIGCSGCDIAMSMSCVSCDDDVLDYNFMAALLSQELGYDITKPSISAERCIIPGNLSKEEENTLIEEFRARVEAKYGAKKETASDE